MIREDASLTAGATLLPVAAHPAAESAVPAVAHPGPVGQPG